MKIARILAGVFFASFIAMPVLSISAQEIPKGYPDSYKQIIQKAKTEGQLSLYSTTDEDLAKPLLDAFTKKYGIKINFTDMGTSNAYSRTIAEAEAKQVGSDLIWSSAMDLQLKLAIDGYADAYHSPETAVLPEWANYKNLVYATTIEPVGMLYNTKAFPNDSFPKTRADLMKYLEDNQKNLINKVATFDPEKSGIGFLFQANDAQNSPDFWRFAKAMGAVKVKSYSATGIMRETVVSGENIIAINVIGSYALDWIKHTPNLGVAFGSDYTAAFSRSAVIAKGAPHPNAARLFLDFMLSREGQTAIAQKGLPSVRTDIDETNGALDLDTLEKMVGGNLKPIQLNTELLQYLKPAERMKFFRQWNAAIK